MLSNPLLKRIANNWKPKAPTWHRESCVSGLRSGIYFPMLMLALWVSACRSKEEPYSDFVAFYEKFHKDSLFQVAHIQWPLEGLPSDADSLTIESGDFKWTQDNWIMHRPLNMESGEYKRDFQPIGPDIMMEKILSADGSYGMIRRYAKMGNDWYLIYYAGMNHIAVRES